MENQRDWRSADRYDDLRSLDAPGFAWEFLSRNPEFRRDYDALAAAAELGVVNSDDADVFARRWGVRVRGHLRRRYLRRLDRTLDTRDPAIRGPSDGFGGWFRGEIGAWIRRAVSAARTIRLLHLGSKR